jgi:hypothetical protein
MLGETSPSFVSLANVYPAVAILASRLRSRQIARLCILPLTVQPPSGMYTCANSLCVHFHFSTTFRPRRRKTLLEGLAPLRFDINGKKRAGWKMLRARTAAATILDDQHFG